LEYLGENALSHHESLPSQLSDTELNDLFAACLPKLKKAAQKMLRNQQDSEDALQDGLLLAFRNLHQFQGRSAFSTWLHSIVRNSSRMHYRKAATQDLVFVELATPLERPSFADAKFIELRPSPEELCIQSERSNILRKTSRELPASYRVAFNCFHLEDLGENETARKLGITCSAVKTRLHRSRRILTSRIRRAHLPAKRKSPIFSRAGNHRAAQQGGQAGGEEDSPLMSSVPLQV
jgi:RNA polymerase sigma-70 factor, ECF subfamily